jgi:class 3 adenylate cyclase
MIIEKYELEKLKTIGDSYMIASGLPRGWRDHAEKAVNCAFEMLDYLSNRNKYSDNKWHMRVGIHSGEVIAGIVGKLKYTYDVWGECVTIAKYLERYGEPGRINVSLPVKERLNNNFSFTENSGINTGVKQLNSYFISKAKVYS